MPAASFPPCLTLALTSRLLFIGLGTEGSGRGEGVSAKAHTGWICQPCVIDAGEDELKDSDQPPHTEHVFPF